MSAMMPTAARNPSAAAAPPSPLRLVIPGEMRGKGRPRFAKRGNFVKVYTDDRTESVENWVKSCAVNQLLPMTPIETALDVTVDIRVSVPASWSQKKRAAALADVVRPTSKPDIDNSLKLIFDSLNKLVWRDDSQITDLHTRKRYAEVAETIITITAV